MLVCLTHRAGAASPVTLAVGPHRQERRRLAGGLPFRRMWVTRLIYSVMYQTARLPSCVCLRGKLSLAWLWSSLIPRSQSKDLGMRLAVGEGPGNETSCRRGELGTRLRCGWLKPLCDSICVGCDLFIHRPPLSRATSTSLSSNQQNRRYERLSVWSWNGLVAKHFHLENYWYI